MGHTCKPSVQYHEWLAQQSPLSEIDEYLVSGVWAEEPWSHCYKTNRWVEEFYTAKSSRIDIWTDSFDPNFAEMKMLMVHSSHLNQKFINWCVPQSRWVIDCCLTSGWIRIHRWGKIMGDVSQLSRSWFCSRWVLFSSNRAMPIPFSHILWRTDRRLDALDVRDERVGEEEEHHSHASTASLEGIGPTPHKPLIALIRNVRSTNCTHWCPIIFLVGGVEELVEELLVVVVVVKELVEGLVEGQCWQNRWRICGTCRWSRLQNSVESLIHCFRNNNDIGFEKGHP